MGRKQSAFLTSHKFVKVDILKINALMQVVLASQGVTISTCLELAGDTGLVAAPAATLPPARPEGTVGLQANSGPTQPESSHNAVGSVHLPLTFFFVTPAVDTVPANAFSNPNNNTILCSALPRGPTRRL